MLWLAQSAVEKMRTVSPEVWLKIGIGVLAIVLVVVVGRKLVKVNKILGCIILAVVGSVVFFQWVYYRNEPKFLTPIVDRIAPFFPTAGAYNAKQQSAPKLTR